MCDVFGWDPDRRKEEEVSPPTALSNLFVIEEVPESIGRLDSLRVLDLSVNKIRRLPTSICDLTNLLVLNVSDNPLDEGIPEEIDRLSALEDLNLSFSSILFLPATVSQLASLKCLMLGGCRTLQEVRELPTSLTMLDAWDCPLDKGIPEEIGRLSALVELALSESKICFLPATFSQLTSLKHLKLRCCEMFQEVRGLPTSLTYFEFSWKTVGLYEEIRCTEKDGTRIITFSGAFELGFLSRLKTLGWSFPNMAPLHTYLRIRDLTLTEMELGWLDLLPSLTKLSIKESHSLLRVSNIGRLRGLRSLEFIDCRALVEIPGPEQLEMLEELTILLCPSIRRIQDLFGLKRLKIVNIWGCSSLLRVPRLMDECRLESFRCDKLRSFQGYYSEYEGESSKIQLEDDSGNEEVGNEEELFGGLKGVRH